MQRRHCGFPVWQRSAVLAIWLSFHQSFLWDINEYYDFNINCLHYCGAYWLGVLHVLQRLWHRNSTYLNDTKIYTERFLMNVLSKETAKESYKLTHWPYPGWLYWWVCHWRLADISSLRLGYVDMETSLYWIRSLRWQVHLMDKNRVQATKDEVVQRLPVIMDKQQCSAL